MNSSLRKRRGLTTIELLAALAIMSLLTAGVAGGFNIARQSLRLSGQNERRAELEAGARALAQIIAQAVSFSALNQARVSTLVFSGASHDLSFVYLNDSSAQWGGFILARIGFDRERRNQLALWSAVYRPETAWTLTIKDMQKADLLDSVEAIEFQYFGRLTDESVPQWRDNWINARRLPDLVHIALSRLIDGRVQKFEEYVSLRHH